MEEVTSSGRELSSMKESVERWRDEKGALESRGCELDRESVCTFSTESNIPEQGGVGSRNECSHVELGVSPCWL